MASGTFESWLDEINLDPGAGWLAMGTRALGSRPWLVVDDRRRAELALKAQLVRDRHDEVFAARPGSELASAETLSLVERACVELGLELPVLADGLHPLDRAGRLVQEDLCLMAPGEAGWTLDAASLCFPSRWRLADKLGRPHGDVHGPVEGYRSTLASRVDRLFDRLGERIVWRRNWFVHPDPALFQPDRPAGGDPVVPTGRCEAGLFVRSERQTLRRLADSGWVLFTIRTQQEPLGQLLSDDGRRSGFARYLAEAPVDQLAHRGLGHEQVAQLDPVVGPPDR
ncbi:MAG: DUF3445 domain-containing protein [Actinomycetota bacterium]